MSAPAEKRIALVVGNSAYESFGRLTNPGNDAEDIASVLRQVGFEVVDGRDLSRRDMDRKLAQFSRVAHDADTALVYYAGHGLQYQGQNYLVPTDAQLKDGFDVPFETIAVESVIGALDSAKGARILILDACRDLPLKETSRRDSASGPGLASVVGRKGLILAYATQANHVAFDGTGRNSFYAGALIKAMAEPGLEVGQVFQRVAMSVSNVTEGRQLPEVTRSYPGEVYLNRDETDIQAWSRLRASNQVADLRGFTQKYAKSFLVDDALARIRVLEDQARAGQSQANLDEAKRRDEQRQKAALAEKARREEDERREAERLVAQRREDDRLADLARKARDEEEAKRQAQARREEESKARLAAAAEVQRRDEEAKIRLAAAAAEARRQDEETRARLAAAAADARRRDEETKARLAAAETQRREEAARLEQARRDEEVRQAALRQEEDQRRVKLALLEAPQPEKHAALLVVPGGNGEADKVKAVETPNSAYASLTIKGDGPTEADAEVKNAVLATTPANQDRLVRTVQDRLHDLGCYSEKPEASWGKHSVEALERFYRYSPSHEQSRPGMTRAVKIVSHMPDQATLDMLNGYSGRICPVVCPTGTEQQGESCVRVSCPPGLELDGGECRPPAKPLRASLPPATPRPLATERPAETTKKATAPETGARTKKAALPPAERPEPAQKPAVRETARPVREAARPVREPVHHPVREAVRPVVKPKVTVVEPLRARARVPSLARTPSYAPAPASTASSFGPAEIGASRMMSRMP
ncbi:caspase family protein [Methylobacterium crusticola]|uniref:caspase family protein n=1 Tax=Methylobacterium crusticola TaxID=1697972 RepID=UPI001EE292AC|nr:caspase family protein [Methylobacterium crusticola]